MKNCKYCGEQRSKFGLKNHERLCKLNPNRSDVSGENNPMFGKRGSNQFKDGFFISDETRKKLSISASKQTVSDEVRKKISESMKLAHSQGKAWNIGKSRWKNLPSYPESFFMKVIANEFMDQEYRYEYPIGIYSFDFAWPSKKKYIEIDGEQHERFSEYKNRDKKKDRFASDMGWEGLRIKWKDLYNNPKENIKKASDFIGPS